MTVAKGDSHQTNPWAVCAHWLGGRTLVCDIRVVHECSRWALGFWGSHTFIGHSFACHWKEQRQFNFTYSLDGFVCFELLVPLQSVGRRWDTFIARFGWGGLHIFWILVLHFLVGVGAGVQLWAWCVYQYRFTLFKHCPPTLDCLVLSFEI